MRCELAGWEIEILSKILESTGRLVLDPKSSKYVANQSASSRYLAKNKKNPYPDPSSSYSISPYLSDSSDRETVRAN